MNNSNSPQMNGIINEFASATRRNFNKVQSAFNNKYPYTGNETTAFLASLELLLDERYCSAVINEDFEAAQGLAGIGRTAVVLMTPFEKDCAVPFRELSKSVNLLEMAISHESTYCKKG